MNVHDNKRHFEAIYGNIWHYGMCLYIMYISCIWHMDVNECI